MSRSRLHWPRRSSSPTPTALPTTASALAYRRTGMALAQGAWVVVAVLAVGVLLASLTGYSIWLQGESPITPGPDPVSGFNVLGGVTSLAGALISLGLGFLLFLRKRHEPMALFVSFYVMVYGV
ncbi:MAG TPA: hypothetical protein VJK02_05935, partial [Anaerolineales bacterium]|nr:hypothetical protein [Anaerolineales bacterium]